SWRGDLRLEDGRTVSVDDRLPDDVPLGYHELVPPAGEVHRLIVGPRRCHLPEGLRTWGWAVQLYAARSEASWGIGDLGDLRRLAGWSARELGAGIMLINPLCAAAPVAPLQPSPYFPTTRRFRHPIYLRVEDVPGAWEAGADLARLAEAGRTLNAGRRIDRDAVWALKLRALERLWERFPGDPRFDRYRAELGAALEEFATFCTIAERHGAGWPVWPPEYRHPRSPPVARFAAEHEARVRFHAWLQWLLDEQLARAATALRVIQDLPIGVDAGGADAWAWQDVLASGATVGAPPDRYTSDGQDWGLPPFVPFKLRAAGYAPFIETIRATLRHAGGLRIDHVMGLFRLFWVPRGSSPAGGAFVRYPADDLLTIVALESARAGAFVVGEDLGTVEEGVRERLAEHRILSYRVLWFEPGPPTTFPALAMAAVTTHDLPTIAGLWTGADVRAQREIGLVPNEAGFAEMRERLRDRIGLSADAPVERVVEETHRLLARAPSALVTATLDDALAVEERPNMPGTTTQWPNWSIALPAPIEEIERRRLPRAIAAAVARGGSVR
ncbi:MAG: 4-alpha-glucanotransferase, partial [Candidatus Rokubacteria bacterium]|nr:4-alpha-glucanotransferase [Candidatus Rokubacteria bacterium]